MTKKSGRRPFKKAALPKKRARKPKKRTTKKKSLTNTKRNIFFALFFSCALFLAFFLWIDSRVLHRLIEQQNTSIAAVYTDILQITPGTKISAEQFREELLARGYAQMNGETQEAGQFKYVAGEISGKLREFTSASGSLYPARRFSFPLPQTGDRSASITLEPRILAPLLSGEQRAHSFKTLKELPLSIQQAVIAIEDERFYKHFGVDLIGIARAMVINLSTLSLAQGGSTLTQQLAKNTLFSRKRVLSRKIMEALAAISIEMRLSKERILELYLNEIYLGQEGSVAIHGVGAASMTFFGKTIEELTLGEAALIAGMIQAPSAYSPRRHLNRALERRRHVLQKMEELGFISAKDREQAELSKPQIIKQKHFERRAPFFVDALRSSLSDTIDLESSSISGLKVYTGINFALQECAEKAITAGLRQIERSHPAIAKNTPPVEAALLAIEPASGLVRAWVGGRSYARNQFDRVTLGLRQAGSTVKPFLYLTALDSTLNRYKIAKPTSILPDQPLSVHVMKNRSWEPENYDHTFRGDVSLRNALENSLNLPAVYVSQKVGIDALVNTFKRFNLGAQVPAVPSIALGAFETTLYRLTSAYAALANGGRSVTPRLYTAAVDGSEHAIIQAPFHEQQLASEEAVFVLTHLLKGVVDRGTARSIRTLGFSAPAAGKTGTSNDARDAWFMGFTPSLSAGVWVGFDDNRKFGLTGGKVAVPIWTEFMSCAEHWIEMLDFIPPAGVEMRLIDTVSARLATSACPGEQVIQEAFVRGTEPVTACPEHGGDTLSQSTKEAITQKPDRRRKEATGFWDSLFNW
jgi:penicillin-binding protein 1B